MFRVTGYPPSLPLRWTKRVASCGLRVTGLFINRRQVTGNQKKPVNEHVENIFNNIYLLLSNYFLYKQNNNYITINIYG